MADELPMLRIVTQRGIGDCTIAVLAMYLGKTYEDTLEAATATMCKPHQRGMWATDMIRTAEQLGVALVRKRKFDFENDTGILHGMISEKRQRVGHAVLLRWGLIIDPDDGELWEPDAYNVDKKAKWSELLTRGE